MNDAQKNLDALVQLVKSQAPELLSYNPSRYMQYIMSSGLIGITKEQMRARIEELETSGRGIKKYNITLRDTVTNERKTITKNWDDAHGSIDFFWTEGNMECDCNRAKFFGLELPCNVDENRFELLGIEAVTE